jgi:hypothetical protein
MKLSNKSLLSIMAILLVILALTEEAPSQDTDYYANLEDENEYFEQLKQEAHDLSYQECQKRYPHESYPNYFLDAWNGSAEEEAYLDSIGYSDILY